MEALIGSPCADGEKSALRDKIVYRAANILGYYSAVIFESAVKVAGNENLLKFSQTISPFYQIKHYG